MGAPWVVLPNCALMAQLVKVKGSEDRGTVHILIAHKATAQPWQNSAWYSLASSIISYVYDTLL
jgi:hypothetical protein